LSHRTRSGLAGKKNGCPLDLAEKAGRPESVKQLKSARLYIGWLERFLVKEMRFAECFPIGTLLSICIALASGMAVIRILYVSLKRFARGVSN
jgi:hypothetical protein